MSNIIRYVKYFIAQKIKGKTVAISNDLSNINNLQSQNDQIGDVQMAEHAAAIEKFIASKESSIEFVGSFIDKPDNRRTNKWPELKKAIRTCQEENATLIIAELGTFTNNETFAKLLLDSNVRFHCCDQPFVDVNILEALYKHAQIQKKVHGKLIKDGLKMTSAKSGNPNAAEVISKVNKPKIHTAIIFADVLSPIISDYIRKGYSQRQMVKMLNEENFTAPEGGKWVLSQLQKVLDRVKLNNTTQEVGKIFEELKSSGLTNFQIAEEFNNRGISSIKRTPWDENQIGKLEERISQLNEINSINKFISHFLPIIHHVDKHGITPLDLIQHLENEGIQIKQSSESVA